MNFYYGLVDEENKAWGFLEETDKRAYVDEAKTELKPTMIYLTAAEWQAVLSEQSKGKQIVGYGGKCFAAEQGRYFVDDNGAWQAKTDAEFNKEKATAKAEELVQSLYSIKAAKAYGGVVINNKILFETNQTAITNTVASLALMAEDSVASWKFYTIDGTPVVQQITKAQLGYIATFGQNMINACFGVEGEYNKKLSAASIANLIDEEWTANFLKEAQAAMDQVSNKIEIALGE